MKAFLYRSIPTKLTELEYDKWLKEADSVGFGEEHRCHPLEPMSPYFFQDEYVIRIVKNGKEYHLVRMPNRDRFGEKMEYGIREICELELS